MPSTHVLALKIMMTTTGRKQEGTRTTGTHDHHTAAGVIYVAKFVAGERYRREGEKKFGTKIQEDGKVGRENRRRSEVDMYVCTV